jgi:hypothetical protein
MRENASEPWASPVLGRYQITELTVMCATFPPLARLPVAEAELVR